MTKASQIRLTLAALLLGSTTIVSAYAQGASTVQAQPLGPPGAKPARRPPRLSPAQDT